MEENTEKKISINYNENDLVKEFNQKFRNDTINSIQKEINNTADKILKNNDWSLIKNILQLVHQEYLLMSTNNGIEFSQKNTFQTKSVNRTLIQERMEMMRNDFWKVYYYDLYTGSIDEPVKRILAESRDSKNRNYYDILYPDTMEKIPQKMDLMTFWQEVNQHTEISVLIEMLIRLDAVINNNENGSNVNIREVTKEKESQSNDFKFAYYQKQNNTIYIEETDNWVDALDQKLSLFFKSYKTSNYFFPKNLDSYFKELNKNNLKNLNENNYDKFLTNDGNKLTCYYKINANIWKALAKPDILKIFENYNLEKNINKKRKNLKSIYYMYCFHDKWNGNRYNINEQGNVQCPNYENCNCKQRYECTYRNLGHETPKLRKNTNEKEKKKTSIYDFKWHNSKEDNIQCSDCECIYLDYEMERILCLNLIMKIYEYINDNMNFTKYMPIFLNDKRVEMEEDNYPNKLAEKSLYGYDLSTSNELIQHLCFNVCNLSNPYMRLRLIDCLYHYIFLENRNKQNEIDEKNEPTTFCDRLINMVYIKEQFQSDCFVIWKLITKMLSMDKTKTVKYYKESINKYLKNQHSHYLHISNDEVSYDISTLWEQYWKYTDNNKNKHLKTMEKIILNVYKENQKNFVTYIVE